VLGDKNFRQVKFVTQIVFDLICQTIKNTGMLHDWQTIKNTTTVAKIASSQYKGTFSTADNTLHHLMIYI
jgi:hypothetical protein